MSNQNPMICEGCYHSNKDGTCGIGRECEICIRNPSVFSNRTLVKTIEIDGVSFTAPLDLYITHDRKRFEEFLLMKKLHEITVTRYPKPVDPNPVYPQPYPYPNYPSPYWQQRWWTRSQSSKEE